MEFNCPHCDGPVIIDQLNCGIFRHGIFKIGGQQMNPHEAKEECDRLFAEDLIYGCGGPFQVVLVEGGYIVQKCDYI